MQIFKVRWSVVVAPLVMISSGGCDPRGNGQAEDAVTPQVSALTANNPRPPSAGALFDGPVTRRVDVDGVAHISVRRAQEGARRRHQYALADRRAAGAGSVV